MSARPLEVRLSMVLIGASALAFAGFAAIRFPQDPGVLRFPIALGVLSLLVVGTLAARLGPARGVGMVFAALAALVHVLITLGDLPAWARVGSGVLAAAHIYVVVLLMTRPSVEHFGGRVD